MRLKMSAQVNFGGCLLCPYQMDPLFAVEAFAPTIGAAESFRMKAAGSILIRFVSSRTQIARETGFVAKMRPKGLNCNGQAALI